MWTFRDLVPIVVAACVMALAMQRANELDRRVYLQALTWGFVVFVMLLVLQTALRTL